MLTLKHGSHSLLSVLLLQFQGMSLSIVCSTFLFYRWHILCVVCVWLCVGTIFFFFFAFLVLLKFSPALSLFHTFHSNLVGAAIFPCQHRKNKYYYKIIPHYNASKCESLHTKSFNHNLCYETKGRQRKSRNCLPLKGRVMVVWSQKFIWRWWWWTTSIALAIMRVSAIDWPILVPY